MEQGLYHKEDDDLQNYLSMSRCDRTCDILKWCECYCILFSVLSCVAGNPSVFLLRVYRDVVFSYLSNKKERKKHGKLPNNEFVYTVLKTIN